MRPPSLIKPDVIRFCRTIARDANPFYVPVSPVAESQQNNCFIEVANHASKYGGEQIIGWAVWHWPRVLIEAEFHSIWQSPSGEAVDITPKQFPMPRVLFFADSKRKYEGKQVDNIRKPIGSDPKIQRMCNLAKLHFQNTNAGHLANVYGEIELVGSAATNYHHYQEAIFVLQQKFGASTPESGGYSRPASAALIHCGSG